MANLNQPRGFVPSRYLNGSCWNGAANLYYIPSTDGLIYSIGDAVKSVALSDAVGTMGCQKADGTDTVRGVIIGFLPAGHMNTSLVGTTLDLATTNIPATKTKAYYALVVDDPNVLFELQDDGASALTATSVNKNASFTVTNPTAPSQLSASVLGCATVNTNNTLNLKIMGLMQRDGNAFGVYAKWLVKFNLHELLGATTAI